MPPPFKQVTIQQFAGALDAFHGRRRINAVHMHHTWKPQHSDYRGHRTIEGMWRHHTQENGWSDIAQHVTIAPDGTIWLGRSWEQPPASASGHNGNSQLGPFMFEMIGNFDVGCDVFEGAQRQTTIELIARLQEKFGLPLQSLVFHKAMSGKTCPGSAIDYSEVLGEVSAARDTLRTGSTARAAADGPFDASAIERDPNVASVLDWLQRPRGDPGQEADAELQHEGAGQPHSARGEELTAAMLESMRPHLINLNMGHLSGEGRFKTSKQDVDAIFEEHLPQALQTARMRRQKLRVIFWAHGGLVKESLGLKIAHQHIGWWRENGVYPIYFVWETGALETIGQLLRNAQQGTTRALRRDVFDHTTDPLIQEAARALQGGRLWNGMKMSALTASSPGVNGADDGGALYAAKKLAQFTQAHGEVVELHAVGHSAGSIFHCHFVPAALDAGVPEFESVQFLAPAVRVDTFHERLFDRIGNAVRQFAIFTMSKSFERDDHCAQIYRKSLLYLVHHALEAERGAPILGLEESIRADEGLKRLLGLGHPSETGEVIWSRTAGEIGRSASLSTTHGGFDDDAATMGSVARRVLGRADADSIVPYRPSSEGARGADDWFDQVDWPEALRESDAPAVPSLPVQPVVAPAFAGNGSAIAPRGTRRALCVGINVYPAAPLRGCVADAQDWSRVLMRLGFERPHMLLDQAATREAIITGLRRLVGSSKAGDVVVFQFAGHGTQLPDRSGDEAGGDSPKQDEALCPYDYATGAYLIDDDLGQIISAAPPGVEITLFMDCCHSGTISRLGIGTAPGAAAARGDELPRVMDATTAMIDAHRRFRARVGASRKAGSGGESAMREVLFSACLSHEVAWESKGRGEFSVHALKVLESGTRLTNEQFAQRVSAAFGASPRQHAGIYCAPEAHGRMLMQPAVAGDPIPAAANGASLPPARDPQVAAVLESVKSLLQQLHA